MGFFIVFALLTCWIVLIVRLTLLQRAYLRQYRKVRGIHLPLSEELRGIDDAFRAFGPIMDAYWEPQADPELERARRQVATTFGTMVAALIGALLIGVVAMGITWATNFPKTPLGE